VKQPGICLRQRPLGKSRSRWKGNIKMNLRETGCENVDWIHLAENKDRWQALVNRELNLSDSVKWWKFLEWLSNYWLFKKGPAPWRQFAVSNNMPKTTIELGVPLMLLINNNYN
jgi:hypothetical protein